MLADVIPPDVSPVTDARALLGFAWQGGFLLSALAGLARTAVSDYRRIRDEIGLAQYTEDDLRDILGDAGFAVERLARNLGHNAARMTFEARPIPGSRGTLTHQGGAEPAKVQMRCATKLQIITMPVVRSCAGM